MELSYKQEIGVGVLVIGGVALFAVLMFWFTGRELKAEGVPVELVLPTAAGLDKGDNVLVSGVKVGRVTEVRLERPGRVLVTMAVDPAVRPRIDARASVASLDFFGTKYVEYYPGEREELLPDGRALDATLQSDLTGVAADLGGRAGELLDSMQAMLSGPLGRDLHNTLVSVQAAMNVIARTGGGPLIPQATATLGSAERLMTRLDSILGSTKGVKFDSLTTNLASLSKNLASATASLDTLLGMMSRGQGTLGKVATDSMLYHNLNRTLVAMDSLLTDLRLRPGRYLTVKVF